MQQATGHVVLQNRSNSAWLLTAPSPSAFKHRVNQGTTPKYRTAHPEGRTWPSHKLSACGTFPSTHHLLNVATSARDRCRFARISPARGRAHAKKSGGADRFSHLLGQGRGHPPFGGDRNLRENKGACVPELSYGAKVARRESVVAIRGRDRGSKFNLTAPTARDQAANDLPCAATLILLARVDMHNRAAKVLRYKRCSWLCKPLKHKLDHCLTGVGLFKPNSRSSKAGKSCMQRGSANTHSRQRSVAPSRQRPIEHRPPTSDAALGRQPQRCIT